NNIIQALYRASQAGVHIDLIVRGMCSLVPGVRGVSDRIRVRSIVGRFLEHSRIFYFLNDGEEGVWIGSADWMPRNLYDRVEVLFPVQDALLGQRLKQEILAAYLADTVKARFLQPDGAYVRAAELPQPARHALQLPKLEFSAQDFLMGLAEGRQTVDGIPLPRARSAERRRIAGRRLQNAE
ncbi:MAG: RNA degradosome polyphosphate kinase, partial [Acidobacteriia bacterium]|nr:RNA degradosome polyphosphate kinase [Terriglobia bacterium]